MPPSRDEEGSSALSAHLTNTSLQESHGEENVRLLQELVGCQILGAIDAGKGGSLDAETTRRLTHDDVDRIVDDVARCLAEAFRAGLTSAVHFQVGPRYESAYLYYGLFIPNTSMADDFGPIDFTECIRTLWLRSSCHFRHADDPPISCPFTGAERRARDTFDGAKAWLDTGRVVRRDRKDLRGPLLHTQTGW